MAVARRSLIGWLVATGVCAAVAYGALHQPANESVLAPARPGLLTVRLPPFESLEPAVVQQIRESHQSFADLVAKNDLSQTDLAESYGSLGQLYYVYGFLDAAEACYSNAIRLAPADFRWPHLLGYLYHQSSRLEEAARLYTAALTSRPEDFPARIYLGDVYVRLDRRADAGEQFQAALGAFPAAARNGLGEIALTEGRFEEAARHFEAALRRVPRAGRLHYSLAMAYRGLGQLDLMQAQLQQVGQAGVQVTDPVLDRLPGLLRGERVNLIQGQLAYEAGQFNAAAGAFGKAVDAAPTSVKARVNLGLALAALGDTERAMPQLQAAIGLDAGNVTAHVTLGALLSRQARDAEAVDHLRAALIHSPDNIDALRTMARSLLKLGRDDDAIDALLKITSLDPADEESLLTLSTLLTRHARDQEARELLDRASRLFPDRAATAAARARLGRVR